MESSKKHWEKVYATKQPDQVSWTQTVPKISLSFIHNFQLPKTARIIDIGGGDSRLVDCLLEEGFKDITVLDISQQALTKAKDRLGNKVEKVTWVEEDIRTFKPVHQFDLWHDRAAFHFLTTEQDIATYLQLLKESVIPGGYVIIGTFSEEGPEKCSGLPVQRYSEASLENRLDDGFRKINCVREDHETPFGSTQSFLFCGFTKSG